MSTNRRTLTSELEFPAIKEALRNFLRGQTELRDYDFDGSNLSILLDVLAYNTHYNALYMNMALNESFLDSANKRSSVVSLVKALGYTPRSPSCARATISLVVRNATTPNFSGEFLTLPRFSPFRGASAEEQHTFYTLEAVSTRFNALTNSYEFSGVNVFSGIPSEATFVYSVEGNRSGFKLPHDNIDISTLKVRVNVAPNITQGAGGVFLPIHFSGASSVDGTSRVCFIQESSPHQPAVLVATAEDAEEHQRVSYELRFGDGVLGTALPDGALIQCEYMSEATPKANSIKELHYDGPFLGGTVESVVLSAPAAGGAYAEEIESIRLRAKAGFSSQNRAVTAEDYKGLLLSRVPEFHDVAVWGGETEVPPQFGKVFISPLTDVQLSQERKQEIINTVINSKKVLTVIPEFKQPSVINLELDGIVSVNFNQTTLSPQEIRSQVIALIRRFNNKLRKFGVDFHLFTLSNAINESISGVENVNFKLGVNYDLTLTLNRPTRYVLNFNMPILEKSFSSKAFLKESSPIANNYFINSDDQGRLRVYSMNRSTGEVRFLRNVGTINYSTGVVVINDLFAIGVVTDEDTRISSNLNFKFTPNTSSLFSQKNTIFNIDMSKLRVDVFSMNNRQQTPGSITR